MDKKRGIWTQIIFIVFIGLVVSGITNSELLDSFKVIWQDSNPEALLENLSLGLGFLALVLIVVWIVIRGVQGD